MRKLTLVTLLLLSLSISMALTARPQALASHAAYDVRDCTAAGQGPNCENILYDATLSFAFHDTWDPAWDYETLTGQFLGGIVYDIPVTYQGIGVTLADLKPTSAIASIDIANGTYYQFTINTGIHARRLNGTTPFDLGVITAEDWAYSILRAQGVCSPLGASPVVYPFVLGANDWFSVCLGNQLNSTNLAFLQGHWSTFLANDPIIALDSDTFAIKVDADFNVTNGQQGFTPFLGVLANSWAAVYSKSETEAQCGALATHLATQCAFMDSAQSIGTGPYLYDETNTDPSKWVFQKNANYCEGGRASLTQCDKLGPVAHSERPETLVYLEVASETSRADQLYTGIQDHSSLAPVSYPRFLDALTTPVFNALRPEVASEYNFRITDSLVIQDLQLLVSRSSAEHTLFGVSPLEGACSPVVSSGCLVRQAIRTAFDYTGYMNNIVLGLGTRLTTFMPDPFPDGNTGAQANGVPLVTRNTTRAVELLLAAGYNNGNKLPTIKCAYNLGNDPRARSCISIANTLEALRSCYPASSSCTPARVDPTCTPVPPATSRSCVIVPTVSITAPPTLYLSGHVDKAEYEIAGTGWFPDYVDEDDYARPYAHSTGTFQVGVGYSNATLDDVIDTAAGLGSGPAREALYFEIERTINNDCQCFIWLQQPEGRSVWNKAIDARIFDRLLNPAFLPVWLDIHKIPFSAAPVFGNAIDTLLITSSIAVVALILLRRTSTRKIAPAKLL